MSTHLNILVVEALEVWLGTVDQSGDVLSVLGHDQLQGVLNMKVLRQNPTQAPSAHLMFLQRCSQLLVLLLQSPDVSVLLLDPEHQLGPRPVVSHLIEVVHVLLVLPHGVHLLQHFLRSGEKYNLSKCKYFSGILEKGKGKERLEMMYLVMRLSAVWSWSLRRVDSLLASVRSCWTVRDILHFSLVTVNAAP